MFYVKLDNLQRMLRQNQPRVLSGCILSLNLLSPIYVLCWLKGRCSFIFMQGNHVNGCNGLWSGWLLCVCFTQTATPKKDTGLVLMLEQFPLLAVKSAREADGPITGSGGCVHKVPNPSAARCSRHCTLPWGKEMHSGVNYNAYLLGSMGGQSAVSLKRNALEMYCKQVDHPARHLSRCIQWNTFGNVFALCYDEGRFLFFKPFRYGLHTTVLLSSLQFCPVLHSSATECNPPSNVTLSCTMHHVTCKG